MEIVRFKAVSTCLGIRRKSIAYFLYDSNKVYDVKEYEHPLNSIKEIKTIDNKLAIFDILSNEDVINFKLKASTLNETVEELCYLDTKLMDINDSNIDLVKNNFDGIFDEDQGEYEFIVGYYYLNKGLEEACTYFKASADKGFQLAKKYLK